MTETGQLSALHTAVSSYLATLLAVSECVGAACPEVGGPYRLRIDRLRSRLAFDTTPEAMAESSAIVEKELADYAQKTAHYIDQHGVALQQAVEALETIVKSIARREDFYSARLRQFAAQMESSPYPTDPEHFADVVALQAGGLLGCVESMSHESQSLLDRMRDELAAVTRRLAEAEVTDPLTGLMNRREMERRIGAQRAAREDPVLVVFEFSGDFSDEVARQVAERLGSQYRHKDLICRWSEREFLVLFHGSREIAQSRTEQILPWIAGKYALDNGEVVEIGVEAGLVPPNLLDDE